MLEAPRRRWLSRARHAADAPPSEEPLADEVDQAQLDATLAALFGLNEPATAPPVIAQRAPDPDVAPDPVVELVESPEPGTDVAPDPVVELVESPEPGTDVAPDPVVELVESPEPEPDVAPDPVVEPVETLEPAPQPESYISDPTLAALFGPAAHWPEPTVAAEPEPEPVPAPDPVWEPPAFLAPAPTPYAEPDQVAESVAPPEPEPELVVDPQPEPELVVDPQPEPELVVEPQPEPELVVEPQPEQELVVEPVEAPDLEPHLEQAAPTSEDVPPAQTKSRRWWRKGRGEETAPEVEEALTLDANVAAFFGLAELQPEVEVAADPVADEASVVEVDSEPQTRSDPELDPLPEPDLSEVPPGEDEHPLVPRDDHGARAEVIENVDSPDPGELAHPEVDQPAPKRRRRRGKKVAAESDAVEATDSAGTPDSAEQGAPADLDPEMAALFGFAAPGSAEVVEKRPQETGPFEAVDETDRPTSAQPLEPGAPSKRGWFRRTKAAARDQASSPDETVPAETAPDETAPAEKASGDDLDPQLAALLGVPGPIIREDGVDAVGEVGDAERVSAPAPGPEPESLLGQQAGLPAEDDLHVVVVPDEDSAEFVAGFLRDVSVLRHGNDPRVSGPVAAADDPVEVIDPKVDPDDTLPSDWAPEHLPRTRRQRKRAARSNAIPVVRAPKAPPTRTQKVAKALAVAGVLCVCAAVPFLVPAVPSTISDLFPEGTSTPRVIDPVVDPDTGGFNGPVGIRQPGGPLAGRELASAGTPLEVQVPRLRVDSQVVPISGQTGELLPPDDPQVLGWWQEGRQVGAESGSAVVTGHTVHTGGGAFDHLGTLVAGDTIRVRTQSGWIGYVVQRSRVYSTSTLARDAASIFSLEGPGRLVLITCSDFNGKIYLSNSVVYAVPVLDEPFVEAPTAQPTQKPTKKPSPTQAPRIPYVPPSTPRPPQPSRTPVPNNGPTANPTGIAGNTGPSGGVTPTEPPF